MYTVSRLMILLAVGLYAPIAAQEPLYDAQCAVCHGEDAAGTDRAPALAGNRRLRTRTAAQIRELIRKGVPEGGMPPFDLPDRQLDALAGYVRALNSPAAENPLPGDAAAGERFFSTAGKCSTCHMVYGKGGTAGPDLSNAAREMTAAEIRDSLLHPGAQISPGYQMVSVKLRDGATVRGYARNRSDFDIQIQDPQGHFHLLRQAEVVSITDEKVSAMPAVRATAAQMRDLMAYLSRLTGVQPGSTGSVSPGGGPMFSGIVSGKPGNWLTYNGSVSGNRYSSLTTIDKSNVSQLTVKWVFSIPHFGLEATPLVFDGIMYVTGPNQACAIDAGTGRQIWSYSRPMTPGLVGDASLGTNRGLAILGDKVFMATDNAHLIAINRTTGRLVWEQVMPETPMHYGSTVAPLIVKDMVIAGVSGGDRGIRGFLSAYNASTGERVWRKWTVPAKGDPGIETWKGGEPKEGGGATWLTGSYDPASDTLYWATGNPYPDSDDHDRGGDNLYTNCVLALDPATGALKWHYQFTPHDIHDWDATEPNVLVDAQFKGSARKLLLHADRNGFFYVLDRSDGKVLLGKPFVRPLTWASGIAPDGRPVLLPDYWPRAGGSTVCPAGEATNWNATAFSPRTRLYYLMALDSCRYTGTWTKKPPPLDPPKKYVRAIDIETGRIVWETPLAGSTASKQWAGVLATAGDLVIYGDPTGSIVAADAVSGKALWHFVSNQVIKAAPMTYLIGERQYVALAAGSTVICFGL